MSPGYIVYWLNGRRDCQPAAEPHSGNQSTPTASPPRVLIMPQKDYTDYYTFVGYLLYWIGTVML
jgi:hypothetical protein